DLALRTNPPEKMSARDRPMALLMRAAAAVGNRELATRAQEDFRRNPGNVPGRVAHFLEFLGDGTVLSLRDETLPQAIQALEKATVTGAYCAEAAIGAAFDRLGKQDSALVYYQRWADEGEDVWE